MSTRDYIKVDGEKVYDWEERQVEYTCDGCAKVMPPGSPQLHLYISGLAIPARESTERPYDNIRQFSIDVHATWDCLKNIWLPLMRQPELSSRLQGFPPGK